MTFTWWKFYNGRFSSISPVFAPNFHFGEIFKGLSIISFFMFWPPKGKPLPETALFEPSRVKIHEGVWPVGESPKKVYASKKFSLYFTHLPRSPPWTDLHESWHRGSCPRRNHLWQIFCQSVKGVWFYRGSNFGIPHWLRQPPLIQCCATARLWQDEYCSDMRLVHDQKCSIKKRIKHGS